MMSVSYSQIIYKEQESIANKAGNKSNAFWYYFTGLAVTSLLSVPVFNRLWHLWHNDNNFGGLVLVPLMFGLILYRNKDTFAQCTPRRVVWILYLLPVTLGTMYLISYYNFPRIAGILLTINFLIVSFGILGYLNYKLFVGPLLFLLLMVPPPNLVIDFMTVNLQKLFSYTMETVLLGFSVFFLERQGYELCFSGLDYPIVITSECSGVRSLLGFVIISAFFAVFDRHSIITSVLMILVGIVTALILNFLRILVTVQMRLSDFEEYSVGSRHGLLGIAVFIVGCLALSILSRFFKPIVLKA